MQVYLFYPKTRPHWLFVCSSFPERWWRRVYDEEFYPIVHLGNSFLEGMLNQYGLKVTLENAFLYSKSLMFAPD